MYYYRKFLYFTNFKLIFYKHKSDLLDKRLLIDDINQGIIETSTVIFETTRRCNLNCKYCSCGQLYCNSNQKSKSDLNINSAILLLEYLFKLKSLYSSKKQIAISFYGGEPLLNFHFIEEIIKYVDSKLTDMQIKYDIVTNGVLLDKYMDYLVGKNFTIFISLDGNIKNNDYRVFKNGQSSFQSVYLNIKKLQQKYPDFFKSNIIIKSVLHNKNSVTDIIKFFNESIDKTPEISSLKTNCIKIEKRHEFEEMFVSYEYSVLQSDDISYLEEKISKELPDSKIIFASVVNYNSYIYSDYIDLIFRGKIKKTPSNTCLPFSKRVFLTIDDHLLPCEKIDYKYSFGKVENNQVIIDYENLINFYNDVFDRIRSKCYNCSRQNNCPQCMFQLDLDNREIECNSFLNYLPFKEVLKGYIELIEIDRSKLNKIIKNNYSLK